MQKINLEIAVNNLSFGNCSVNILKQLFKKGVNPTIFLIGEKADFSAFEGSVESEFLDWFKTNIANSQKLHNRDVPTFKLWHINGSLNSFSKDQFLFTFYELDNPTRTEINILNNQKKVIVSSNYTKNIFNEFGCENIEYCPLGFDSSSFFKKEINNKDDKIVFGLAGKLEKRKQHHKVLTAWVKKYGNNPKYMLNCAIRNPFLTVEQETSAINNVLGGNNYFNINFLDFMAHNSTYNDYLNSNDIMIGMSSGEGWGLPEFQSVCLGKHAVILNAHSYKDWANSENSILVNPTSKIPCYDGAFFREGLDFNQGSYFDWDEDEFISACELAEKRFENNKNNAPGEELSKKFTWERSTDRILDIINK
jgi:glycosyltransferase involved in cell wall biosynthesis